MDRLRAAMHSGWPGTTGTWSGACETRCRCPASCGMLVFASHPVSPPRLADLGLVDTVTDSSAAYRWWQPPAVVNRYAAMPGPHADRELLVGMASFSAASTVLLRPVGVILPILMTWSVVATANPSVLDVVAGIALALVGHAVALLVARRRASRAALGGRRPG